MDWQRGQAVTMRSGEAAVRFWRDALVMSLRFSNPSESDPTEPPQQMLSERFLAASTSFPAAERRWRGSS